MDGREGERTNHTLCLGSPVYTVKTVTGRLLSTTLMMVRMMSNSAVSGEEWH